MRPGSLARKELWTCLLIGLLCFGIYNANGRAISAGDTYPARYLPFAIWKHETLHLGPIEALTAQGRGHTAFWIVRWHDGRSISLYPVVAPTLLAPLYLPAVGYLNLQGWTDARLDCVARVMEKLSASLVATLSVSLLYLLIRRRGTPRTASLLALAYGLGTTTWVISSQALWQHGMAQLLVVGALLFLTGPRSTWRVVASGLLCGLVAGNRPPDAILAAALLAYGLVWAGRQAPLLVASAVVPAGLVLLYNVAMAGHVAGAYALFGKASFLQHDLLEGIAGVLFSPMRGLFVFSPFLLFLGLAFRHLPSDRGERLLTLALSVGVVLQVGLYAKTDWRAGISWGPRYMTDFLPMLMWLLAPVVDTLRGLGRAVFVLLVGVAVTIETIGAFWYTGETDQPLFAVATGPTKMRAAWDWRNAPFVASLRRGPAPPELTVAVRGSLDSIRMNGEPVDVVTFGDELIATGWARAGDATPSRVAVVIDGWQTVATRSFVNRRTLDEANASVWRISLDTVCLPPGEHRVTALAWAYENGEGRYLGERKVTVLPAPGSARLEGAEPGEFSPDVSKPIRRARGSFDSFSVANRDTNAVLPGENVVAAGSAMIGSSTPWQVAVLIDCQRVFTTRTFARNTSGDAGWQIPIETAGLAPGEHTVTALVWASEKLPPQHLAERTLTIRTSPVETESLDARARKAEATLREHQKEGGYWLTSHTKKPQFLSPRPELNVFLTGLLVDLLAPIEISSRLSDNLARARQHLRDQIEPNGLVRYHGLPNAPGIGTLGCIITPDTDDTALAWRIAPKDDLRRRSAALEILDHYRTPEGLHRTWLASREDYECLDPGSDPNPADLTIQMHLLLLLAEASPAKARELCETLRRVVDEDRVWVYYQMSPLVPLLRLPDLRRVGCSLALPASRTQASVPGQEIWVSVVQFLETPDDASKMEEILNQLSRDDFALLRSNPPLLYHNDLTATVARYYWSEDVGYALWLRLHRQHARLSHSDRVDD